MNRDSRIRYRLVDAQACLALLDEERAAAADPRWGQALEDRLVWRELLDLELQDYDAAIERICAATD